MDIKECDIVRLKDGREGTVLGVWADGKAYEVELVPPDLETVEAKQIEKVIYQS
jgi:glycerate kinase